MILFPRRRKIPLTKIIPKAKESRKKGLRRPKTLSDLYTKYIRLINMPKITKCRSQVQTTYSPYLWQKWYFSQVPFSELNMPM